MLAMRIVLVVALIGVPLMANAAELTPAPAHRWRAAHRPYVAHRPWVHFGYYGSWWGYRSGGTARCWCGSTFVDADQW